jgi:superfamily II DNA or RNA helicase/phage anti-repressor protein
MLTNKTDEINKLLFTNNNFLFMSATPLVFPLENNNIEIFGNNIFELSWNDAIQNKYICDYNFYYPNNEKIIDRINEIKFDKTIIDKTILINKAYYLLESIKITNVKKCIVYLKSLDESNQFMKILNVINIYFELKIKSYEINYETTKILRNKYLNKFINDNTSINLILNVHIFDEGIDIPQCDSIYLTHPNNNIQNIIQRISRANRLDVNNIDKIAKVFIWSKDKIKLENIISNISKIIKVKYGAENNDFINYNNEHNISINNNVLIDNNKINFIKHIKNSENIDEDFYKFINDFYSFYDEGKNEYDKTIDLEKIAKWLNVRKDHIKRLLIDNFDDNIDYDEIKIKNIGKGKGSNNRKTILLTYDCAKLLCMISKSEKADVIRKYYIELEKLLIKFQR